MGVVQAPVGNPSAPRTPDDPLAEVATWCTEGFDTTDLQEAKALLEELA
jgi:hypothetical protein